MASPTPLSSYADEALLSSGPLTSVQIFERVSPAIVFIETVSSTGSGVLVEGGHIVTNAHVIWPYQSARLVFPDGSEFQDVPLVGWDLMADIAVLGPVDVRIQPLALADGEDLPAGSEIYLIGYPGETEAFPQPAIVQGLLSRVREWDTIGITYLQTDAPLIGGQSGGALVSEAGDVIGITGFGFTEGAFGVVASSVDVLPRLRQLISGGDPSGLGHRRVPLEGGRARHVVQLGNIWAVRSYVINELPGTVLDFELVGDSDGALAVYDLFGTELLYVDQEYFGPEFDSLVIEYGEPHFLNVWQLSETPGNFTLTANLPLVPIDDPDDGRQLEVGRTILGNFDFPFDVDHYFVQLEAGETIEITTRSALADTYLSVDYLGALDEQVVFDDDGGGGLFGLDSTIVYRAPHAGNYFVAVQDSLGYAPGGYVISMESASPRAEVTSGTWESQTGESDLYPDFRLAELRSAFEELPAQFEEVDPSELGLSVAGIGLEDYFSSLVYFASPEAVEFIMALSGQIADSDRTVFDMEFSSDTFLNDILEGFLKVTNQSQEGFALHEIGLLDSSAVGVASAGAYIDFTIEGVSLHMEMIMFRRGDLVGIVYSYTVPGETPTVPVRQAAGMLDAKMSEVILAR